MGIRLLVRHARVTSRAPPRPASSRAWSPRVPGAPPVRTRWSTRCARVGWRCVPSVSITRRTRRQSSHETISTATDAVTDQINRSVVSTAGPAAGGDPPDPVRRRLGGGGPRQPPRAQQGCPPPRRGSGRVHTLVLGIGVHTGRWRDVPGRGLRRAAQPAACTMCWSSAAFALTGFPEAVEATAVIDAASDARAPDPGGDAVRSATPTATGWRRRSSRSAPWRSSSRPVRHDRTRRRGVGRATRPTSTARAGCW